MHGQIYASYDQTVKLKLTMFLATVIDFPKNCYCCLMQPSWDIVP